jgi:hypothetical protein
LKLNYQCYYIILFYNYYLWKLIYFELMVKILLFILDKDIGFIVVITFEYGSYLLESITKFKNSQL